MSYGVLQAVVPRRICLPRAREARAPREEKAATIFSGLRSEGVTCPLAPREAALAAAAEAASFCIATALRLSRDRANREDQLLATLYFA